jgi:tetratricopeptide (TPR) repeat protein
MENDKIEQGLALIKTALQKDPNLAYIYKALGDYRLKTGQHAEAIKEYQQAIKVLENPNTPFETMPYNELARLYRLVGNYQKADELSKRDIEQNRAIEVGGNPGEVIATEK